MAAKIKRFPLSNEQATVKSSNGLNYYLGLVAAFILVIGIYIYYARLFSPNIYSNLDSLQYLAAARGEVVGRPFDTRIIGPLIARLLANAMGVSLTFGFYILTATSLLVSLLCIVYLLKKKGATLAYQIAVIICLGASLAALYARTPILVDPLLLLLACLVTVGLSNDQIFITLGIICIAALTKEYGIALLMPWMIYIYRQKSRWFLFCAVLPVIILSGAKLLSPVHENAYQNQASFLQSQIQYHYTMYQLYGLRVFLTNWYYFSWAALWPLVLTSIFILGKKLLHRLPVTTEEWHFAGMALFIPVLMTGDWDRTFAIIVPFACLAATSAVFTQQRIFNFLLAFGGLMASVSRSWFAAEMPFSKVLIIVAGGLISFALLGKILNAVLRKQNVVYQPSGILPSTGN
jgi:hypothetical protein